MSVDRRRAPRIELLGRVQGQIVPPPVGEQISSVAVTVREMSLGGLSFHSSTPFTVGHIQEFHLTLGDESTVVLRGRVVRSREETETNGSRVYVTGVEFVDDDAIDDAGGFIEKIK